MKRQIVQFVGGDSDGFEIALDGGPNLIVGAELKLGDEENDCLRTYKVERIEDGVCYAREKITEQQ
jgi:hypothetical protein